MNRGLWSKSALAVAVVMVLFAAGCATQVSRPAGVPAVAKVPLGQFKRVEMQGVVLNQAFAAAEGNQRAVRKIDTVLFERMGGVFPGLTRIETSQPFSTSAERTLQITPYVKEIKFVSGGARFMVGAMAGSSVVLMQLTFRDGSTGEVIADPEYLRVANAYSGGQSIGYTDNRMLEEIVEDFVTYATRNY